MKLSIIWFGLWLFFVPNALGQKDLSRTYVAEGIENILVDANGVHSLLVIAKDVNKISVEVHLEGETSEEIVIKEVVKEKELTLGFGFWPLAKKYNDKLSAHKIVSVVVKLTIPKKMIVAITSNTTAVKAEGVFEMLFIDIEDKDCVLNSFNGDATIVTKRGNIFVSTTNSATKSEAKTTYGTLQNTLGTIGNFTISAQSTHGNISLQQTQ